MKCIIRVVDEVNCILEGLDVGLRRRLVSALKQDIPHARFMPAVRLGRWDGKKAFFNLNGSTSVNLLPTLLPLVEEAGYDIELQDQRSNTLDLEFIEVQANSFAHCSWPKEHSMAGEPIELRDHQVQLINVLLRNPQSMVVAATGSGKTLVTASLSQRCESYGRTIVIVPNKSLVIQTERDYKLLGLDVGVWFGDRKDANRKHTICTWQSLNVFEQKRKKHIDNVSMTIADFLKDVVAVIVDECFAGHSRVLTPSGWVQIKDINSGDHVLNLDEESGKFKVDVVIKQHKNLLNSSKEKMFRMEFDNGSVIDVSGNHKFLTTAGWVRADELTENHEIVNYDINTLR